MDEWNTANNDWPREKYKIKKEKTETNVGKNPRMKFGHKMMQYVLLICFTQFLLQIMENKTHWNKSAEMVWSYAVHDYWKLSKWVPPERRRKCRPRKSWNQEIVEIMEK